MRFDPSLNVIDLADVRSAGLPLLDISREYGSEVDTLPGQMRLRFEAIFQELRLAYRTLAALKASALQAISCPTKAKLSNALNTFSLAAGPFLLHFEIRANERAALVGVLLRNPPPDGGGSGGGVTAAALNSSHLENRIAFAARRYGSDGLAVAAALVATYRGEMTGAAFDALCRARRILTGVDPSAIVVLVLHEALHASVTAATSPPRLGDGVGLRRRTLCHTQLTGIALSGLPGVRLRLSFAGDAALRFQAILSAAGANDDDT